jgi:hypothetical protein
MAITNYTELQTSVTNWLSRTNDAGLIALFPDCITLAESKFNRALKTRNMETTDTLTPVSGVCTLPTDYIELRRIYIDTDNPIELEYLPPEQFYVKFPILRNSTISPSRYYTIEGDSIVLSDQVTTNEIKILYYQKIPALSISNTTNWLLTNHPDIYLCATLAEAYDIIKNEQQVQKWNAKTVANVEQLIEFDKRGKYSGSAMRVIAA